MYDDRDDWGAVWMHTEGLAFRWAFGRTVQVFANSEFETAVEVDAFTFTDVPNLDGFREGVRNYCRSIDFANGWGLCDCGARYVLTEPLSLDAGICRCCAGVCSCCEVVG